MKILKWVLFASLILLLGFTAACDGGPSTDSGDDDDDDDEYSEYSDDDADDDDDVNDDANDDDIDDDEGDDADDDSIDDDLNDDVDDDTDPPTTTTSTTPPGTTTTTTSTSTTTSTVSVPEGWLRIDLTWGFIPSDLDLHMWAPHDGCEAANPFHLYYPDAEISGGHGCSEDFALELDDASSFGPEIIMVYEPMIDEDYHVLVHDYTNKTCISQCMAMSNSNNLKVAATTSDSYREFHMPANTSATLWDVFTARYNESSWEFTPIDEYCFAESPGSISGCPLD